MIHLRNPHWNVSGYICKQINFKRTRLNRYKFKQTNVELFELLGRERKLEKKKSIFNLWRKVCRKKK